MSNKKRLALALITMLVIATMVLTACGGGNSGKASKTPTPSSTPTMSASETIQDAALGDNPVYDVFKFLMCLPGSKVCGEPTPSK